VLAGKVAVVLRLDLASVILRDIAAAQDPLAAQGGKALLHRALEGRVSPGSGAVVDPDRCVGFHLAAESLGGRKRDLTQGNPEVGMQRSFDVDAAAGGKLLGAVGLERGLRVGDHRRSVQ